MNKMKELLKDEGFQEVLLTTLGYSLAYAVFAFGVLTVWKWYVAYTVVKAAGLAVTSTTLLKGAAASGAVVVGGGGFCRSYRQWKADKAAEAAQVK